MINGIYNEYRILKINQNHKYMRLLIVCICKKINLEAVACSVHLLAYGFFPPTR